ncbi:amidohydrolase family protein [Maricaulaceae bacterium EIL42A08]|nr:amidohydrolase family protein [Maricaulaceae bacterium EIL42A08]
MTMSVRWVMAATVGFAVVGCGAQPAPEARDEAAATTPTVIAAPADEASSYTVLVGGTRIGAANITRTDDGFAIEYEFRNNGRGPTLNETISLNDRGYPVSWAITGNTTFGNAVDEMFEWSGDSATWRDATGEGSADMDGPAYYVPQNSSPYQLAIAARLLLADEDRTISALPSGELRLTEMEEITLGEGEDAFDVTAWALSGTSTSPTYFLMDGAAFFGVVSPGFAVLAEGQEAHDEMLRARAAEYGAQRYEDIQQRTANRYEGPVAITNVHVFDPATESRGEPSTVVFEGNRITAINPPSIEGMTQIDGAGGTLVPGLFEMHAHLGESAAALGIAAGITSVRDMGNNNDVLSGLIANIEIGRVAGPRVFRSGFIEGRSPFNSNNGILVGSEEEAVEAVRTYANMGGFHQIKVYNSMDPEWIPAVIAEAREHGLRVTGHVPAFTDANAMIAAGYDELTHINQLMLGWVLDEGEDTRTLLRLTALKRLPELDLDSEQVQSTIDAMVEADIAIDPTFAIHEALLLSRNGELSPGAVDYIDNMPASSQRQARSAWAAIESEEDDIAYRGAFEQITAGLAELRDRGIFMVPGTDLGGSFAYHRELELYQTIGMEPAEILAWASQGMADYLGAGDELGSVTPGKYADFFLVPGDPTADFKDIKTISMVVADGVVYFPSDIYPEFGIRPFVDAPEVTVAQ